MPLIRRPLCLLVYGPDEAAAQVLFRVRKHDRLLRDGMFKDVMRPGHAFQNPTFLFQAALDVTAAGQHGSVQSPDDLTDLLEDLADLALADDQRRRHRDRVADDAEHDAFVVEAALHRFIAALTDRVEP